MRYRRGVRKRALMPVLLVIACVAPGDRAAGLDVDRVLAHVGALARQPRPGDSAASREAAADIIARLGPGVTVERMPVGTVDLPAIEVLGTRYRSARRVTSLDPALLVRFGGGGGGGGKALLVMAHYDTVPGSPGAIDNAAAVGILIVPWATTTKSLAVRPWLSAGSGRNGLPMACGRWGTA